MPSHAEAMRRAIRLAWDTHPHPNPRVGAVIVDAGGEVIAEGAHAGPGSPHAEVVALQQLGHEPPPGSTMVVTLEPCDHQGRTPPCTSAIVAAGIGRVVVGQEDPDPKVSGRGIERLRLSGIEVEVGVLAEEVESLDFGYFIERRQGRASFTLKQATTLDGQTAAADGTSQWITGADARDDAHRLRARHDAIMVGAGTLRRDDPHLDVRLDGYRGPQPVPVVVAGASVLPSEARLWSNPRTLVITVTPQAIEVEQISVPADGDGMPNLMTAAVALAERGLIDVLVEGGATLAASLWNANLVDRGVTYLGARLAGGSGIPGFARRWETLDESREIEIRGVKRLGADLRVDWRPLRELAGP